MENIIFSASKIGKCVFTHIMIFGIYWNSNYLKNAKYLKKNM